MEVYRKMKNKIRAALIIAVAAGICCVLNRLPAAATQSEIDKVNENINELEQEQEEDFQVWTLYTIFFPLTSLLFLRVAGTAHWAVCTPAPTGGFSFFLIADHTDDDGCHHGDQHRADDDICDIFRNPCKHFYPSLFQPDIHPVRIP